MKISRSPATSAATGRPRLGVSSCLLGEPVRYDGRDKREPYLVDELAPVLDLFPVCPEMAIGLGVPRPPIHLVGDPRHPRVLGVPDPTLDVTAALQAFGRRSASDLQGLSGYLLKRGSPSCGLRGVTVAPGVDDPGGSGMGVYAGQIRAAHPALPMEDEQSLRAPGRRANFVERVFLYWRWQQLSASGVSHARLQEYHGRLRLSVLSRGSMHYRRLGQLLLAGGGDPPERLAAAYLGAAMRVLARPASRKRQAEVLAWAVKEAAGAIPLARRGVLRRLIAAYRRARIPLSVPLDGVRHALAESSARPLLAQYFLSPDPTELRLRSGG